MNKTELIEWYNSIDEEVREKGLPQYKTVDDALLDVHHQQIFVDGKLTNMFYVWSVFSKDNVWKYVETDKDRGYVFELRTFETENQATEYAKKNLTIHLKAYLGEKERKAKAFI